MGKDIFSIDLENIDVEDIMKQIRKKIADEKIQEKNVSLENIQDQTSMVKEHLRMVNLSYNIIVDRNITSHRPFIGKIIILVKKCLRKLIGWYIRPIIEQQNELNAHITRTLNSIDAEIDKILGKVEYNKSCIEPVLEGVKEYEELSSEVCELSHKVEDNINKVVEELQQKQKRRGLLEIDEKIREFEEKIEGIYTHNKGVQAYIDHLKGEYEKILATNNYINTRVKRVERKLKYGELTVKEPLYLNGEIEKVDFDYFMFEERYRGSQEEIKKRLEEYASYFVGQNNILDIGCGRGELLEVLKEQGIQAKGIELDEDMVLMCKDKELDVIQTDAIEYLKGLEDNSLGGIVLTQVIEHLSPNYLIQLIEIAYQKLKPNATFIAETINPQSLIVFTEAYFMDLSHIRMIHPLTIRFLLEGEGFREIDTKYLSKVGEDLRIPQVESLPEEFNHSLQNLNNLVYGYRDYAIIGRK
jgi:O-antigen chain-terminating methyltransferase